MFEFEGGVDIQIFTSDWIISITFITTLRMAPRRYCCFGSALGILNGTNRL